MVTSPRRRAFRAVAWLAGLPAVLAACSPPTPAASGRTLTIAVPGDVTGIYPGVRDESYTFTMMSNAFEGLTRFDRDLRAVPAVAARWESPDDSTWIFRLRDGLRFSDGSAVRAEDVVASVRFAMRESATRHLLASLRAVDKVGEREVRIATNGPAPTILSLLTQAFVLPEARLGQSAGPPPPGTGPYAIQSWSQGQRLVLARNPYRAGTPAGYDTVVLEVIPKAADRADALLAGRVQLADQLSPRDFVPIAARPDLRIVARPALRVLFLAWRMDRKPFDDPRVREALTLGIDRDRLVARALGGQGTPASQLVPPAVPGYNPAIQVPRPDRERARALLREAGLPTLTLNLVGTRNRYVNDVEILDEVGAQLREIGVRVTVEALDKEAFFPRLGAPETAFYMIGWSCDGADAGSALGSLLHSPDAAGLGFENSQSLADPELDRLIDQALAARLLDDRAVLLRRALQRAHDLRAIVPLVIQHEAFGMSRSVAWEPPLDMALRLHDAH